MFDEEEIKCPQALRASRMMHGRRANLEIPAPEKPSPIIRKLNIGVKL